MFLWLLPLLPSLLKAVFCSVFNTVQRSVVVYLTAQKSKDHPTSGTVSLLPFKHALNLFTIKLSSSMLQLAVKEPHGHLCTIFLNHVLGSSQTAYNSESTKILQLCHNSEFRALMLLVIIWLSKYLWVKYTQRWEEYFCFEIEKGQQIPPEEVNTHPCYCCWTFSFCQMNG